MGNLRSVEKAFESIGSDVEIVERIHPSIERLVIPGVGAFAAAMERLRPLKADIQSFASGGAPLLGICLGQQLLFDGSDEHGSTEGLGLVPGWVRYLPRDVGLKVPHMGWSPLEIKKSDGFVQGTQSGDQVYFVHSLFTDCAEVDDIAATASYGLEFAAAIQRGNIWAAQFHPEKSGDIGLRMLRNFAKC